MRCIYNKFINNETIAPNYGILMHGCWQLYGHQLIKKDLNMLVLNCSSRYFLMSKLMTRVISLLWYGYYGTIQVLHNAEGVGVCQIVRGKSVTNV